MSDGNLYNTRRQAARRIAAATLERRAAGEALPDAAVLATHRDLQPELAEELEFAGQIRLGVVAGEKSPAAAPPQPVLSWHALERPIDEEAADSGEEWETDGDGVGPSAGRPQLPGYLILDQIGRGGHGTVYRAIQESTDRPVAIKVMAARAGSRYRARIEREAKLLASLRHPHIVGIIERTQTASGAFCLVMEFVEGRDLDAWWADVMPAGWNGTRQLLDVFIKLAQAIGAMHDRGIVHRDLKPSNIKIDADGEPRILDFGLARVVTGAPSRVVTTTGQILGSLPWASPEQAGGGALHVGPASDVYSLAVMLYQALTGRFPYPIDGTFLDRLLHIAKTVPLAPRLVAGSRPTGAVLDRVILTALAKRPEDRYANGRDLAEALQDVVQNGAGGPAWLDRLRRVASIALMAGLCLFGLSVDSTRPRPPARRGQAVLQLPTLTNSLGMTLIRVPAGRFEMGDATTDEGQSGAIPSRLMTIPSEYFLGATEVTQAQYRAVMGADPSDKRWLGPQLPVQNVSWAEANEFCRRLSKREGRKYRLPSSAEWEYACRAGTTSAFGGKGMLDLLDWYLGNSGGAVHPVGCKMPNPWGFYDVHGNVEEWCTESPSPDGSGDPLPVIRGGSALRPATACRSAAAIAGGVNDRFSDVGFRLAMDP
ncbi:MAG TPA: bifunctional serine/threonine-protein kinase/formylglycine-generating enzyme family protein [Tepidisphaeraceae bacterium]